MSEQHEHHQHADPILVEFLQKQNNLEQKHNLSSYENGSLNTETANLTFAKTGKATITAKVQVIGTFTTSKNQWQWSWGNTSVSENLKQHAHQLKKHFQSIGAEHMLQDHLDGNEQMVVEIMAIATHVLNTKGAYRHVDDDTITYMAIMEITSENSPT